MKRFLAARRTTIFRAMLVVGSLALSLGVAELYARHFFRQNHEAYELPRLLLCRTPGHTATFQNCVSQPYLLYAPSPNLDQGLMCRKHSYQGFRGDPVPLERTPRVARVLCTRGSTTYGVAAIEEDSSYPTRMQAILSHNLPEGTDGVEVINAGLPFGTSAEILTHYLFKYRYFKPDLVVIQTGGNDAMALRKGAYYQPDYAHMRQPLDVPHPLSSWGRTLCQSRLASWVIIRMMFDGDPRESTIQLDVYDPPPVAWHPAAQDPNIAETLSDEDLAFTHNLHALVTQIRADGAKVLFVPFRLAPGHVDHGEARHEGILKQVALEREVSFAPFPVDAVDPSCWMDDCHLNVSGCFEKAWHLSPFVHKVLWPNADPLSLPALHQRGEESAVPVEPALTGT